MAAGQSSFWDLPGHPLLICILQVPVYHLECLAYHLHCFGDFRPQAYPTKHPRQDVQSRLETVRKISTCTPASTKLMIKYLSADTDGKFNTGCSFPVHASVSYNLGYYYTTNTGMVTRPRSLAYISSGDSMDATKTTLSFTHTTALFPWYFSL